MHAGTCRMGYRHTKTQGTETRDSGTQEASYSHSELILDSCSHAWARVDSNSIDCTPYACILHMCTGTLLCAQCTRARYRFDTIELTMQIISTDRCDGCIHRCHHCHGPICICMQARSQSTLHEVLQRLGLSGSESRHARHPQMHKDMS